jgi:hypothetical protein
LFGGKHVEFNSHRKIKAWAQSVFPHNFNK